MATMAWDVSGSTFVSVTAAAAPASEDWEAACRRMAQRDFKVKLIWTLGGSPNSAQRLKAREILGEETEPLALVTNSMAARAVLGIMGIFFKNMRAFGLSQVDEALGYLNVPADERPAVLGLLARLRGELGIKDAA